MQVEVCAFSLDSCRIAQDSGADRIELCGGAPEGGTTPSYGLIQAARELLVIELYVMIRPRGGDFLYTDLEFEVMQRDVRSARACEVDGLVFGLLRADGTVDEERTRELVELAHPLPVTFHRAFDMSRDPEEALEAVIRTGAKRILTSGQQASAEKGILLLEKLVKQAAGRIQIMAGAGVTPQNATRIAATGVQALHLTGKKVEPSPMTFRHPSLTMASVVPDEYERLGTDPALIRQLRLKVEI
ncbi:copper homeostasis protein CutC [Tellurirhabdus rosea]|uniref:copper homeostasis protein CutC n=1 Tax=Tellurirhabdus rosea TaxID=2674997 RepID=UPI00224EF122|nr:copper homeostasis protein CutC [Tellurirhabdus rosea]